MAYNLPDGCRDDDPDAPWNQKEETPQLCEICGGPIEQLPPYNEPGGECFDCGTKDPEDVKLCSMCGDYRPKVKKSDRGYRAECECGVSGQFEDNAEAALTSWNILNG